MSDSSDPNASMWPSEPAGPPAAGPDAAASHDTTVHDTTVHAAEPTSAEGAAAGGSAAPAEDSAWPTEARDKDGSAPASSAEQSPTNQAPPVQPPPAPASADDTAWPTEARDPNPPQPAPAPRADQPKAAPPMPPAPAGAGDRDASTPKLHIPDAPEARRDVRPVDPAEVGPATTAAPPPGATSDNAPSSGGTSPRHRDLPPLLPPEMRTRAQSPAAPASKTRSRTPLVLLGVVAVIVAAIIGYFVLRNKSESTAAVGAACRTTVTDGAAYSTKRNALNALAVTTRADVLTARQPVVDAVQYLQGTVLGDLQAVMDAVVNAKPAKAVLTDAAAFTTAIRKTRSDITAAITKISTASTPSQLKSAMTSSAIGHRTLDLNLQKYAQLRQYLSGVDGCKPMLDGLGVTF